eukprot:c13135_g1_i3.p1 GENE.c13135_g1_i3~~c13135_g1_i3.p1  ORF type:complete len:352 (-),score=89.32 c13135_g1_i3:190-1245(-)
MEVAEGLFWQHRMQPHAHHVTADLFPFSPRQLEYHPSRSDVMCVGTTEGAVVCLNHHTHTLIGYAAQPATTVPVEGSSVLGLCWLHDTHHSHHLLCGSEDGTIRLLDTHTLTPDKEMLTVTTFESFPLLTSLHANCNDTFFATSGYSPDVSVYDLHHGRRTRTLHALHSSHINVIKFANLTPYLLASASFDRTVKLWDLREANNKPVYTRQSETGHVMVCFSSDDRTLLTSAVDNDVRQYSTHNGQQLNTLRSMRKGATLNFTRAYYANGCSHVISGGCEETMVRIHCARSGRLVHDLDVSHYVPNLEHKPYVQSLRADPHRLHSLAVLVSYVSAPSRIMLFDMLRRGERC